jgi:hypothetical protein
MTPLLLSGARIVVKLNGAVQAAGFVLNMQISTAHEELDVVDSVVPAELAPNKVKVHGQLQIFRSPSNDPVGDGYAPGGANSSASMSVFTNAAYSTMEIRDQVTDTVVMFLPRFVVTDRGMSVRAGDLLTEAISISAIGFTNQVSSGGVIGAVSSIFS